MHQKLDDLLKLLLGLFAAFDVVEGHVDVLRGDLVRAAAHSQERDVEDLRQRDDDGDDDQDGRHLVKSYQN